MKKRIALLILRFGSNTEFFDLWAKSAAYNEEIDFLIFTNCKSDYEKYSNKYSNIKFLYVTQAEVEQRIKEKTGFDYKFVSGYKLCDFKPALGLLFEDYIEDYDFWGYCDTDLIFGNMKSFITDNLLDSYDRLFVLGHLSIYKNTDFMKRLFLQKSRSLVDFESVCKTDKVIGFDELEGMHQICMSYGDDLRYYTEQKDIYDIDIFHYQMFKSISTKLQTSSLAFVWKDGELVSISNKPKYERPILYAHFQKRKMDLSTVDLNKNEFAFFCAKVINVSSKEDAILKWKKQRSFWKNISYYLDKKIKFYISRIKGRKK